MILGSPELEIVHLPFRREESIEQARARPKYDHRDLLRRLEGGGIRRPPPIKSGDHRRSAEEPPLLLERPEGRDAVRAREAPRPSGQTTEGPARRTSANRSRR